MVSRRAQIVLGLAVLLASAFAATSAGQGPARRLTARPRQGDRGEGEARAEAARQARASPGSASALNKARQAGHRDLQGEGRRPGLPPISTASRSSRSRPGSSQPRSRRPIGSRDPSHRRLRRARGRRHGNARRTRDRRDERLHALEQPRLAGINTASIGDPIIQPGDADGGSDPAIASRRSPRTRRSTSAGGTNTMDAAHRADVDGERGHVDACPTATARRARHDARLHRPGGPEVRRTTGSSSGTSRDRRRRSTSATSPDRRLLPGAGAVRRPVLDRPGPVQRARRLGLAHRHAGRKPAGRPALRGRRRPHDREPDRPVLQRFGVTIDGARTDGRASARSHRSLRARRRRAASSLSWTAPAFDGGSPITNYRVYRGTSPGRRDVPASAGTSTSFVGLER